MGLCSKYVNLFSVDAQKNNKLAIRLKYSKNVLAGQLKLNTMLWPSTYLREIQDTKCLSSKTCKRIPGYGNFQMLPLGGRELLNCF